MKSETNTDEELKGSSVHYISIYLCTRSFCYREYIQYTYNPIPVQFDTSNCFSTSGVKLFQLDYIMWFGLFISGYSAWSAINAAICLDADAKMLVMFFFSSLTNSKMICISSRWNNNMFAQLWLHLFSSEPDKPVYCIQLVQTVEQFLL